MPQIPIEGTTTNLGENFTGKGFRGKGTTSKESLQTGGVGRGVSGGKGGISAGTGQLNASGGRLNPAYAKWQDYATPQAKGPPIDHKTLQNGVNMMADAAMRYQDRKDQMSATDAFLAAQAQVRELRLGVGKNGEQTGYLATSGKAAMNGYGAHVAGFNSAYQAGADSLSGNARQKYLAMSVPQVNKLQDEAARQRFNGEKQYQKDQLIMGLNAAIEEGAVRPDDVFKPDPTTGLTLFQTTVGAFDTPQERQAAALKFSDSVMKSYYRSMQDRDAANPDQPPTAYQTTRGYFEGIKDNLPADAKNSIDSWLDARESEWRSQVKRTQATAVRDYKIGLSQKAPDIINEGFTDGKAMLISTTKDSILGAYAKDRKSAPDAGSKAFIQYNQESLRSIASASGISAARTNFANIVSADPKLYSVTEKNAIQSFLDTDLANDLKKVQDTKDIAGMGKVYGIANDIASGTFQGDINEVIQQINNNPDLSENAQAESIKIIKESNQDRSKEISSEIKLQQDAKYSEMYSKLSAPGANQTQILQDARVLQANKELSSSQMQDLTKLKTKGIHPKGAKDNRTYMETYSFISDLKNGYQFAPLSSSEASTLRKIRSKKKVSVQKAQNLTIAQNKNAQIAGQAYEEHAIWYTNEINSGNLQPDSSTWQEGFIERMNMNNTVDPSAMNELMGTGVGDWVSASMESFRSNPKNPVPFIFNMLNTFSNAMNEAEPTYYNRFISGKEKTVMEGYDGVSTK